MSQTYARYCLLCGSRFETPAEHRILCSEVCRRSAEALCEDVGPGVLVAQRLAAGDDVYRQIDGPHRARIVTTNRNGSILSRLWDAEVHPDTEPRTPGYCLMCAERFERPVGRFFCSHVCYHAAHDFVDPRGGDGRLTGRLKAVTPLEHADDGVYIRIERPVRRPAIANDRRIICVRDGRASHWA